MPALLARGITRTTNDTPAGRGSMSTVRSG
jgi:hypothetical protein